MIKLSEYIFSFFQKKGICQAFMLPGGGAMHLVDSLGHSDLDYVCCAHEQGAAIAAESYGQHKNSPALLLVTSGPGVTNAITGITAAYFDSTPVFVLSGQAKRADLVGETGLRTRGSQEVQTVDMVKPVTKYAAEVLNPEEIAYHLERAYHEAMSGRKGPVWISVPLDVQAAIIDEGSLKHFVPEDEGIPDISKDIEKTVELLKNSKKPLVLAGNGIKLAGVRHSFEELIRTLNIPVQTTWKTIDMFDEDDPLYVGHPGIMGDRGANLILQECDLLLALGSRLDSSLTAYDDKNFARNADIVMVDIDRAEIDKVDRELTVSSLCDVKYFIEELLKSPGLSVYGTDWLEWCKAVRSKYPVIIEDHIRQTEYISVYGFMDILCDALTKDDVIVPESSGGAGEITYQAFRVKKGQSIKNAAALGSMGFGLPYAIGACLSLNRRRTILINGDGAFALNIQELETLKRLNLPVKIFILNNGGYASIRSMQNNVFNGFHVASGRASGFTLPDFTRVADSYGIKTFRAENNNEIKDILTEVLDGDSPALCELMVLPDETVSPRVKSVVHEDGSITSGKLENMWPFLSNN